MLISPRRYHGKQIRCPVNKQSYIRLLLSCAPPLTTKYRSREENCNHATHTHTHPDCVNNIDAYGQFDWQDDSSQQLSRKLIWARIDCLLSSGDSKEYSQQIEWPDYSHETVEVWFVCYDQHHHTPLCSNLLSRVQKQGRTNCQGRKQDGNDTARQGRLGLFSSSLCSLTFSSNNWLLVFLDRL